MQASLTPNWNKENNPTPKRQQYKAKAIGLIKKPLLAIPKQKEKRQNMT